MQRNRRRRKTPAHIVSFDEKDESPLESASPALISTSAQSASFLCSPMSVDQKLFNYVEESKKLDQNSASPSSNDSSFQDFDLTSRPECSTAAVPIEKLQILTPVSDNNVGELILISGEEMPQEIIEVSECDDGLFESVPNIKLEGSVTDENVKMLVSTLEQLKEVNLGLKTKLVSLTVQHKEESSKLHSQLQALTR